MEKLMRFRFVSTTVGLLMLAPFALGQDRGSAPRSSPTGAFSTGDRDPESFFRMMAKGKDVVVRSEVDPSLHYLFDFIAKKLGVTDGRITLEQFRSLSDGKKDGMSTRRSPGSAAAPATAPPAMDRIDRNRPNMGRSWANPNNYANWADDGFRRADQNQDGVLDYDEMPEQLQDSIDIWDRNENGTIDLDEYRAYHVARIQQSLAGREEAGIPTPWSNDAGATSPLSRESSRPPLVYRKHNLPPDLPEWFRTADGNGDTQVSLFEWRQDKKRALDEFLRLDRNNDGLLTVDEYLRHKGRNGGSNGLGNGGSSPPPRNDAIVRGGFTPPADGNAGGGDRRDMRGRGNDGERRYFERFGGERGNGGDRRNFRPPNWNGERERRGGNQGRPTDR
jgi:hypothetical protein